MKRQPTQAMIDMDAEWARDRAAFMKSFADFITKNYGERCPEVCGGCGTCGMWAAYDLVNALVIDYSESK